MTCDDFETAWMDRLDRPRGRFAESPALTAHVASCPRCREAEGRYLALESALPIWASRPRPSTIERERLIHALKAAETARSGDLRRGVGIAAAAVLALFVVPGFFWREPVPLPKIAASELPAALSDAGAATLALARESSAPAAKLGAAVLAWSSVGDERALPDVASPLPRSAEVIQSVGQQVNEGVKPLRGSALKAFDFLIAPVGADPEPRNEPARGA